MPYFFFLNSYPSYSIFTAQPFEPDNKIVLTSTNIEVSQWIENICTNSDPNFNTIVFALIPLKESLHFQLNPSRIESEKYVPKVFSWRMITINTIIVVRKVLFEIIYSSASRYIFGFQVDCFKSRYDNLEKIFSSYQLVLVWLTSFSPIIMSLMNRTVQFCSGGR